MLVEDVTDMVYQTDLNGISTHLNPSAQEFLGVITADAGIHFGGMIHRDYRREVTMGLMRMQKDARDHIYQEFLAVRPNGEEVWIGQNVRRLTRGAGAYGFGAVARDITIAKGMELRLKSTKEAAEEANRAKSRFLSLMSHELRTPLTGINGFSGLLQKEHYGALNEKQLQYVQNIDKSGKHLLDLITDLLDVSKIDSGVIELELEEVPIDVLLETVHTMVARQAEEKGMSISVLTEPGLTALGDVRRCRQVLLNLLNNAIKFTPHGGHITASMTQHGASFVKVSVSDMGPGIEKADQENIFSEFYQSDHVRDAALGGSGIGLAIARRLVELHCGEIGVECGLDRGSTFWFTLPVWKGNSMAVADEVG